MSCIFRAVLWDDVGTSGMRLSSVFSTIHATIFGQIHSNIHKYSISGTISLRGNTDKAGLQKCTFSPAPLGLSNSFHSLVTENPGFSVAWGAPWMHKTLLQMFTLTMYGAGRGCEARGGGAKCVFPTASPGAYSVT